MTWKILHFDEWQQKFQHATKKIPWYSLTVDSLNIHYSRNSMTHENPVVVLQITPECTVNLRALFCCLDSLSNKTFLNYTFVWYSIHVSKYITLHITFNISQFCTFSPMVKEVLWSKTQQLVMLLHISSCPCLAWIIPSLLRYVFPLSYNILALKCNMTCKLGINWLCKIIIELYSATKGILFEQMSLFSASFLVIVSKCKTTVIVMALLQGKSMVWLYRGVGAFTYYIIVDQKLLKGKRRVFKWPLWLDRKIWSDRNFMNNLDFKITTFIRMNCKTINPDTIK